MNISKTTINFARKRGIDVYVNQRETVGESSDFLCFDMAPESECCEWAFSYRANTDGSWSWGGNIWLPRLDKEELPATITDEKHLRQVIEFIAPIMVSAFNA